MYLSSSGRQGLVSSLVMPIVSSKLDDGREEKVGGCSPTRTDDNNLDTTIGDHCAGENTNHLKVYQRFVPCMGTSDGFVSHSISSACRGSEKKQEMMNKGDLHQEETTHRIEELPVFVKARLEEMSTELVRQLGHPPYSWSNKSIFYNQSYLDSRDFKLMFLRAELFRPKPAADRYVKFLRLKLGLFGWDKLTRDIVQADLDQEDIIALQSGFVELIDVTRAKSRTSSTATPNKPSKQQHQGQHQSEDSCCAVVVVRPHMADKLRAKENAYRALFYLFYSFLKCHTRAQQHGLVGIMYHSSIRKRVKKDGIDLLSVLSKLQGILPWRFSSFHFCVNTNPTLTNDTGMFGPMAVLSTTVMKYYFRIPFQCHIGTNMECMFKLIASGIPQEVLATNPDTFDHDEARHFEWLHQLRERERDLACTLMVPTDEMDESSDSSSECNDAVLPSGRRGSGRVNHPQPMDVLLGGRGRSDFRDHEGNLQLHHMVKENSDDYMKAEPLEKMDLADGIVRRVRQNSGRFLKQDPHFGFWRVLDDEVAAAQVTDSFRARQDKQRHQQRRSARDRQRQYSYP